MIEKNKNNIKKVGSIRCVKSTEVSKAKLPPPKVIKIDQSIPNKARSTELLQSVHIVNPPIKPTTGNVTTAAIANDNRIYLKIDTVKVYNR